MPSPVDPVRILFLHDHLLENGGLRVVHNLILQLQGSSVQPSMFVLQSQSPGAVLAPSREVRVVFGVRRRLQLRWAILPGTWRLLRESRRNDVLIAASEIGVILLLGWLVATLVRKPFVVLVQAPLESAITYWTPAPLQAPTRWVNARVTAAICVSPGLVQSVVDNGLAAERVHVMPVGVDVERIRSLADALSPVPAPTGQYVVAVGRLTDQKGFDLLIRAHAIVVGHGVPHTLVILGEGDDRAELEQLAERLGVKETVMMPGFIDNPHPLVAHADVYVLSSRTEGMGGLVLLEAMAHGIPIIATDCVSGPRELLDDGALGELIPTGDVDALARTLLQHLRHPSELRRRARGGPRRAQDFDPAHAAGRFSEIIHDVASVWNRTFRTSSGPFHGQREQGQGGGSQLAVAPDQQPVVGE